MRHECPEKIPRFRVDKIEVGDGIYGPDHPWTIEHRVVDAVTGAVVLMFEEWPDLTKPWDPSYEGVSHVEIVDSGAGVVVTHHDGTVERLALPLENPAPAR